MKEKISKAFLNECLASMDIMVNGSRPWDLQVHNEQFFQRILNGGSLALGESYMDAWWSCEKLDDFFERLFTFDIESKIKTRQFLLLKTLLFRLFNFQNKKRARMVGKQHYDLGNELFQYMLDSEMNYTCGYWKEANTLEEAQQAKLKLTCEKLQLKPGMRLLDIGCGWGAFAKYAAQNYGVNVVGITISEQQVAHAKLNCRDLPIDIRLQDYRDINNEVFDRVVSLGMFEHVGHLNYKIYMKKVHECLTENGLFLLHTIGSKISLVQADEWIATYIFPNGILPSIAQIGHAIEPFFIMEDWHNFGADYEKTLLAWHQNFNHHWQNLSKKYDDRFYRMWTYYLLSCAGCFRVRDTQLWQIVLSKKGIRGGYQAPR